MKLMKLVNRPMTVTGILGHLNISDGFKKIHTDHMKKALNRKCKNKIC